MEKKSIGILGGMGPLATADLFRKIVLMTDAERDADHIRIYMDNHAEIPDRTAAILSGGEDPVPYMAESLKKLELCGADCIVMPCNTAHYFLPQLQAMTKIPFISILESAAAACRERYPGRRVAITATTGTIRAGLYQDALKRQGVEYLVPDEAEQAALMRVIYEGVKMGRGPAHYGADWRGVTESMKQKGAEVFLLGCTELPLAAQEAGLDAPSVDPTGELAAAAIRFCGYRVKSA